MKRLITQGNRSLVSALLASAVLLAACAAPTPTATPTSAPAAAPTPTKVPTATPTKRPVTKLEVVQASVTSAVFAPSFVAKEKGYFLEESLDVSYIVTGSGAKALAAVIGRGTPIGQVAASDVVTAIAQGQPAKVFAQVSTGVPGWVLLRKEVAEQKGITPNMPFVEKVRAVKGLTFAASSPGSGTDYSLRYVLTKAGVDPDRDVNITYIAVQAMLAAFEQGTIDGFSIVSFDQALPPLEQGKAIALVDFGGGEVPGTADNFYIVALTHREELDRQPELFEAYTRGLWRAMKLIVEGEAEARDLVQKAYFPNFDPALYRKAWDFDKRGMAKEPTLTDKALRSTLDFRNATAPPPALDVKFSDFGTNRFVEAAKKQLGF